jgi:CysZ protein
VASVVAAPFLDVLSRRVEAILTGRVEEQEAVGLRAILRDGGRALVEEAKRTSFFLALQIGIAFLGFVVPGGQLVAPPAAALLTILFLPLDHASYALDRRRVRFREKRRWIREHAALMLGYGGAAFALYLVPGLNFLAMPVLVASGTVLALRHGPHAADDTAAAQASSAR